eukprot:scaffold14529_cov117-Isochrysis_galbana.AAC.10
MQLLAASRTTSYSTSFQPLSDFSTSSCGAEASAVRAISVSSSGDPIRPEPRPPSAKAARIMHG